ncbi:MAG: 3-deoxy-D-manno-octulosonic acid transferase [Planctomycetota bacterium]
MTTARSRPRVALAHAAYDVLFLLACVLATLPWLVRAWRDPRQLRWARERLGRLPDGFPAGAPVWVHAVSVGEVKAARPLVRALLAHDPRLPIVLSTSTTTGYETARRQFPDLYVFHAPLDLAWVVRRVLRRLGPRLIVLLELEVWPALLRVADELGVPQVIVNGRVTEQSWRSYRRWRWWLPEFDRLALVAAQDETYRDRIAALGVPADRLHVTGNLKHELAGASAPEHVADLAKLAGLDDGLPVFVAGSTHAGEDEPVVRAWRQVGGGAVAHLVLVPRHLDRVREITRLLRRLDVPFELHSQGGGARTPGSVLILDSMGELETLFALAAVVFLGGSLVPVGGHNVLEPAAAGCPVLVGPHLESCRAEAELLREAGGLEVVADAGTLAERLAVLLGDSALRTSMGERARGAVAQLQGAAEADVRLLADAGLLDAPALAPSGG